MRSHKQPVKEEDQCTASNWRIACVLTALDEPRQRSERLAHPRHVPRVLREHTRQLRGHQRLGHGPDEREDHEAEQRVEGSCCPDCVFDSEGPARDLEEDQGRQGPQRQRALAARGGGLDGSACWLSALALGLLPQQWPQLGGRHRVLPPVALSHGKKLGRLSARIGARQDLQNPGVALRVLLERVLVGLVPVAARASRAARSAPDASALRAHRKERRAPVGYGLGVLREAFVIGAAYLRARHARRPSASGARRIVFLRLGPTSLRALSHAERVSSAGTPDRANARRCHRDRPLRANSRRSASARDTGTERTLDAQRVSLDTGAERTLDAVDKRAPLAAGFDGQLC